MSTSGSIVLNQTRNDFCILALELLGVASSDSPPKVADINRAATFLNMMLNSWNNQGNILFTKKEAILVPQLGQASYGLGSNSQDYCSETVHQTTAAANAIVGATSISVVSSAGFVTGMTIGIQMDSGYAHFTPITNVSGVNITFTAPLPTTVTAANGNYVYAIGDLITRPLDIYQLRFRANNYDNYDRPVQKFSRSDYFALPAKANLGAAVAWYYDPQIPIGRLYIWNASQSVQDTIRFTYQKSIEMFDSAGNTPDLPNEWNLLIVYSLAALLGPVYGKEEKVATQIGPFAAQLFEQLSTWDNEHASYYFQPDRSAYSA